MLQLLQRLLVENGANLLEVGVLHRWSGARGPYMRWPNGELNPRAGSMSGRLMVAWS
jgi:hypothetical protein